MFFGICLFLFFHFRQTFVETLELGTLAKKYVVAEVDFAFPDEEATIILKQEAGREIGNIYRLSPEEIQHHMTEIQKYITQSEEGIKGGQRAQIVVLRIGPGIEPSFGWINASKIYRCSYCSKNRKLTC